MTYLVERLAELRRHLDHLRTIGPRVTNRIAIERDLSLHNDVMFSLLMVAQLVVDVAGELSARRGDRFEDYAGAIRNLARDPRFPTDLVQELERVPGFRNVYPRVRGARSRRRGARRDGEHELLAVARHHIVIPVVDEPPHMRWKQRLRRRCSNAGSVRTDTAISVRSVPK
jgi:uncharacterized protein YutE (UPF0331/DUF86 family)